MKIEKFEIEESKVNKGCLLLVATTENGERYVMSGDHWTPTYLVPYDKAFDTKENKKAT